MQTRSEIGFHEGLQETLLLLGNYIVSGGTINVATIDWRKRWIENGSSKRSGQDLCQIRLEGW
jgi:hypothetical protein